MHAHRLPLLVVALIAALACLPAGAQVVTSTVATQVNPASGVVNPVSNQIFVANNCGNDPTCTVFTNPSVTVINGATLATQNVGVGYLPYGMAVDTGLNQAYVATCANDSTCGSLGAVTEINGATLSTANIAATGYDTAWVVVNQSTHNVYAVNLCNDPHYPNCTTRGTVTVFNGNNLNGTPINVNAGAYAYSAAVNALTNTIYVMNECGSDLTCSSAGTVTVINGNNNQVITTITVGFYPLYAAVDSVHNKIYVTNYGGADGSGNPGSVSVINGASNTVEATLNVEVHPGPVAFNSVNNTAYVGNCLGGNGGNPNCTLPPSVSLISGDALTATLPVCPTGYAIAADMEVNTVTNKVYLACQGVGQLGTYGLSATVLDGATNATFPIAVGDFPNAAMVNSSTNEIYVPNQADNTVSVIGGATELQLNAVTPCRLVDTRLANGGGGPIQGGTFETFNLPQLAQTKCTGLDLSTAASYSLNVTLIPYHGQPVGYLTIWPASQIQPFVSTMNSDGRIKANAAIVSAGVNGGASVFVYDTADVVLDIDGYFGPSSPSTLAFYPLTPCRVADTRSSQYPSGLGPPSLSAGVPRNFPVLESPCIPSGVTPAAYSFNFTAIPNGHPLGYLTVWPEGETQPFVSTLNAPTGTVVANAAIVPAGTGGGISAFAFNNTDLAIDINGYFAAPGPGGLSQYPIAPCRVLDTRNGHGAFSGLLSPPVNPVASSCAVPSQSQADTFNATVVPVGSLGYLTLWPNPGTQPFVSTLNAYDGAITSNMAVVPTGTMNGEINAFAYGTTQLILDISSFFAP